MAVTKRRNSGPECAEILPEFLLKICKIFRHGIFNQKLKLHLIENFILYTMLYVNLQN
jgi:hypothetical protein